MTWLAEVAFWWLATVGLLVVFVALNARRPKKHYPQPPISTRTAEAIADLAAWDAELRGHSKPSNTPE